MGNKPRSVWLTFRQLYWVLNLPPPGESSVGRSGVFRMKDSHAWGRKHVSGFSHVLGFSHTLGFGGASLWVLWEI